LKSEAEALREWLNDEILFHGDGPMADQCCRFTRVMFGKLAKALRDRDQYTPVVLLPSISMVGTQAVMKGYTAPNLVDFARVNSERVSLELLLRCDTVDDLAALTGI
jgi:hypothetical protein